MNKFQKSEDLGRSYLKELLKHIPSLVFEEDQYAPFDAQTENSLIEIKVRDCNSNSYPDFILEVHKVTEMMKASETKNLYYVNFFKDGKVAFWNIRDIIKNYNITSKNCKRTTAVYGGYREKQVYMIELKDAKVYNYKK